MRRKLFFLLSIFFLILILPQTIFADTSINSAVFLNADTNQAIYEIGTVKNIKAKLRFSSSNEGNINIIMAGYDADDRLVTNVVWETTTVTAENKDSVIHTMNNSISVDGVNTIKVFAWEELTLKPVLTPNGVLNKVFAADEGFVQKLTAAKDVTQENPLVVVKGNPVLASDVFETVNGAQVNSEFFNVSGASLDSAAVDMDFAANTLDWRNATLTFNATGLIKLMAFDYDFCIPAYSYVRVIEPVDRYYTKFENTDDYLYRIGNKNNVSLSSLFAVNESTVPISDVKVEIATKEGNAIGTYTPNTTDWSLGTIKFSGTGVVSVSIKDDNSKAEALLLEVIDAKNITKAENVSANDVVLLNNISGTFAVSNGHTFYGNGFTVTLPTIYLQSVGGFSGYISLGTAQYSGSANGGNLDNVKIVGPVYPEMYIYRDQAKITDSSDPDYGNGSNMRYFKNSVIVYGGNCTISNSYISGSRTALCLNGGNNVIIEDTTLSGGTYANMQICSGSSVTLRNLTTVQADVADSYGKGKTVHGLGVVVDSGIVDINIEGELNQYNWICQEQWSRIVPSNYQSSFPKFFTNNKFSKYWHYLNGGTAPYVNMAFIYACNWDTSKIYDNRATVDYETCDATVAGVAGGVYSKVNTVGGNSISDSNLAVPVYTSTGFNPIAPGFNFDNSQNNDADDANDANDTYCVYNESNGTLKIGITGASKTLDLSKVTIDKNGTALDYKKYLNGTEIPDDSVTIKSADGAKQKLIFKVKTKDCGYDKDGNPIAGEIEYAWTVTIEVATLAFPAPVWNMGGSYTFDAATNCVYVVYPKTGDPDYGNAVPIYEGIKINYYNKNGELIQKNFSGTTAIPTGSNNANANAFTCTLADGSTLAMQYVSGWKVGATTHQFTTYEGKVYIYPQQLDSGSYADNNKTTFNIKINYTFTDPNGQIITKQMTWSGTASKEVYWATFDTVNGKAPPTCVTGDALVALSDGSYKRIDQVTYEDELLVWNFYEGTYDKAKAAIIFNHGTCDNTIIDLMFEDSTAVSVVNLHQFFDADENRYVNVAADTVETLVGHRFVKIGEYGYNAVKLVGYKIRQENTDAYGIISSGHYNIIAEGMLTTDFETQDTGLFNYFDVGENLTYKNVNQDIERYGLYTYKDFEGYLTPELFDAFNVKYMKVAVGKGQFTYEGILSLIEKWLTNNNDF